MIITYGLLLPRLMRNMTKFLQYFRITDTDVRCIQHNSVWLNYKKSTITKFELLIIDREVKLICLPSDSMGDRGQIKVIIHLLSYLHGQLMTPLFCNDHANVNHCSKKKSYATPTGRNDFWQSDAEIVVIYIWAQPSCRDKPLPVSLFAGI